MVFKGTDPSTHHTLCCIQVPNSVTTSTQANRQYEHHGNTRRRCWIGKAQWFIELKNIGEIAGVPSPFDFIY